MLRNNFIAIITVGITLGTAWSVRGQFGHAQGAAWAGGIAALVLILVAGRDDWYRKIFTITLSAAIGWGVTGMISYGRVVGYGRSDHFPNVLYGLMMLFVIGALFGLLGGGLTSLSLNSSKANRVKWGSLLAEMAGGGLISYYFLVNQLWIYMTPPRSEAWAVCLGAGLAMLWHMARNNYNSPIRVAVITALGTGFGFAFGNFLQTTGNVLEINFNMWNVMEYSIGFFGGTSMTYGILTSRWTEGGPEPAKWVNWSSFLIVFLLIPVIVFRQSVRYSRLLPRLENVAETDLTITLSSGFAAVLIVAMIIFCGLKLQRSGFRYDRGDVKTIMAVLFGVYIMISYIVTGAFAGSFHLNHHLFVVNYIAIMILTVQNLQGTFIPAGKEIDVKKWLILLVLIIITIFLLTLVSINIHDGLPGAQYRFETGS